MSDQKAQIDEQYRYLTQGPTPEQLAQYKREDAARKKWFPDIWEHASNYTKTALLLESMSDQITTLSAKVDILEAKLSKGEQE